MMTTVKAIKNFGYPKDLQTRDAIRAFHGDTGKKNIGKSWDGDRGEIIEVLAGDILRAPEDLLDSWLAAALVLIPITVDGDSRRDING